MNITRATDYAIRLLVHLASGKGEGSSRQLAEEIEVPFNHLAKLVQALSREGYIITKKGKGGGIKLAKDPKKIDLAEVIETIEGPMVLSNCIFHRKSCSFSRDCKFRKCLSKVQIKMQEILSQQTIFDLVAT